MDKRIKKNEPKDEMDQIELSICLISIRKDMTGLYSCIVLSSPQRMKQKGRCIENFLITMVGKTIWNC